MKKKWLPLVGLIIVIAAGCSFSHSENRKGVEPSEDGEELLLAKKSLKFIEFSMHDSLKYVFNDEILKQSNSDQLDWLFEKGKSIMANNEYPNDSMITVSTIIKKSILGEETFKEFVFPFVNNEKPDSTMYFKITIVDSEIHRLILSTGRRFK